MFGFTEKRNVRVLPLKTKFRDDHKTAKNLLRILTQKRQFLSFVLMEGLLFSDERR